MRADETTVEKTGNVLACSLALYWFCRGALIFSATYRDIAGSWLQERGGPLGAVRDFLPGISFVFLVTAILVVLRPADRRVGVLQVVLVVASAVAAGAVAPDLIGAAYGPVTKGLAGVGAVLVLMALARPEPALFRAEVSLRRWLGATCAAGGLATLIALPVDELAAWPVDDPRPWVLSLGALQAAAGVVLALAPAQGSTVRAVLMAMTAAWCLVPAVAAASRGWYLYHPLAPHLQNLPALGCAVAALVLGASRDVVFAGRLRAAEVVARITRGVRRPLLARFPDLGEDDVDEAGALRGLLDEHASGPAWRAAGNLLPTVLAAPASLLPRTAAIAWGRSWERRAARAFDDVLDVLDQKSLSRRVVSELAGNHRRWRNRMLP